MMDLAITFKVSFFSFRAICFSSCTCTLESSGSSCICN
jgi:hypothetical protein